MKNKNYYINPEEDDKRTNERLERLLSRSFARYWKRKRVFDICARLSES